MNFSLILISRKEELFGVERQCYAAIEHRKFAAL
jgi:hypothetical protein